MDRQQEKMPAARLRRWLMQEDWKMELVVLCLLTGFAFFINRDMKIKGLYMDDLYQWFCYDEEPFWTSVVTMGGTRFRVLYNLVSRIQMEIIGAHVNWYVPFNILLNSGLAFYLYRISKRLSCSGCVGFFSAVIFLASRMSYYQIGQILGLMETMALWLAIALLYQLFEYLNGEDGAGKWRIYPASLLYVAVCFVHERYMVLFPLFLIVCLFRKERDWKMWLAPAAGFGFVQLMRFISIGTISPAGTGGTDVVETMSVKSVLGFVASQLGYLFGLNAGPEHLSGQHFSEAPAKILAMVAAADLMLFILVAAFAIKMVRQRNNRVRCLQTAFLFVAFIGACILCSSVTIRVEMRWVYVSYAAALWFISWIYGVLTEGNSFGIRFGKTAIPVYLGVFAAYIVLMLPVENYYRSLFPNLYYWADQERYNSLAEETYGHYGDAIFGKTIYVVGRNFEMEEFTKENFFEVFDPLSRDHCVNVVHIDDVRQIGLVTDDMLIMQEDVKNNRFQDVTHVVKKFKWRPVYGIYEDGWVDELAELQVMAGSTGMIKMDLTYPRDLTAGQKTNVYVNGQLEECLEYDVNTKSCWIEAEPYEVVNLRFESNFYVPNALEKRGETCLAVLMHMTAD